MGTSTKALWWKEEIEKDQCSWKRAKATVVWDNNSLERRMEARLCFCFEVQRKTHWKTLKMEWHAQVYFDCSVKKQLDVNNRRKVCVMCHSISRFFSSWKWVSDLIYWERNSGTGWNIEFRVCRVWVSLRYPIGDAKSLLDMAFKEDANLEM